MAAISVTAANVLPGANFTRYDGIAGAAITAGQVVYLDPTSRTVFLSDANGSAAAKNVKGISLNGAAVGQPVCVDCGDTALVAGGTLVTGTAYYLGETPGSIVPFGDLASGDTCVFLGVATSTTTLNLNPLAPVVLP